MNLPKPARGKDKVVWNTFFIAQKQLLCKQTLTPFCLALEDKETEEWPLSWTLSVHLELLWACDPATDGS